MPRHDIERYKNEFIQKANKKHEGKYDYGLIDYFDSRTKVSILCKDHGVFWQTPSNHVRGNGCPDCARKGRPLMSEIDFIRKSKETHGDRYLYDKTTYKGSHEKVTVTCKNHGDFEVKASNHIDGHGCRECYIDSLRMGNDEFIRRSKEIHGDRYCYDQVSYIKGSQKVCIICKTHGPFHQEPVSHLLGHGCRKCACEEESSSRIEEYGGRFIERCAEIHGGVYDYSNTVYNGAHSMISVICPIHGMFEQKAYSHLNGKGCMECSRLRGDRAFIMGMSDTEKALPYYLYHVRFVSGSKSFEKIGVTKHADIETRFKSKEYSEFHIEVISSKKGMKADILLEEIEILEEMDRRGIRFSLKELRNSFGGWTECFKEGDFDPSEFFLDK